MSITATKFLREINAFFTQKSGAVKNSALYHMFLFSISFIFFTKNVGVNGFVM